MFFSKKSFFKVDEEAGESDVGHPRIDDVSEAPLEDTEAGVDKDLQASVGQEEEDVEVIVLQDEAEAVEEIPVLVLQDRAEAVEEIPVVLQDRAEAVEEDLIEARDDLGLLAEDEGDEDDERSLELGQPGYDMVRMVFYQCCGAEIIYFRFRLRLCP